MFIQEIIYLKLKNGAYEINLDEQISKVTHWMVCLWIVSMSHVLIVLEMDIYQEKIKICKIQKYYNNCYSVQAYYSIICGYFCIEFIDFMLNNEC